MFESKKLKNWTELYWNQIKRNIGLISFLDQEKLRKTPIAVFGLGGLGGPLSEQLVRSGCEKIVLCDNEKFEESNLNRQLCTREEIGKYKVDVIEEFLKNVNPEIEIHKFYKITIKNISEILRSIKISALTLDDPIISILISRECLKNQIPVIESWGFPYICAWWFTKDSINYEQCYGLATQGLTIKELKESKNLHSSITDSMISKIFQFPNLQEYCDREPGAFNGMKLGKLPLRSFAPMVRMSAAYLTFEIIFAGILKIKEMILAPKVIGFDYIRMKSFEFSFI